MCLAYLEYHSIKNCTAFNVTGHIARRKLNQYATRYEFEDDSILTIYDTNRYATVIDDSGRIILIGKIFKGTIQ